MIKNPFSKHSINYLIKVEYENGVRGFTFIRNIVCCNKGHLTTELLTGIVYPLFNSLDSIPPCEFYYIVLKGYNKEQYKDISKQHIDANLKKFYSFYADELGRLDFKKGRKALIARNIYKMISRHEEYNSKKSRGSAYTYK